MLKLIQLTTFSRNFHTTLTRIHFKVSLDDVARDSIFPSASSLFLRFLREKIKRNQFTLSHHSNPNRITRVLPYKSSAKVTQSTRSRVDVYCLQMRSAKVVTDCASRQENVRTGFFFALLWFNVNLRLGIELWPQGECCVCVGSLQLYSILKITVEIYLA